MSVNYLDYETEDTGLDLSTTITRVCICGGTWFRTIVSIDEEFEISAYGLDGECIECGTRIKLPCPVDRAGSV